MKTTSYDISLRPICKADIDTLAQHLRPEDAQELTACYLLPPRQALELCCNRSSLTVSLFCNGHLCALAGVEPESLLGWRGCVWSWTSRQVLHYQRAFWKISKYVLAQFLTRYPLLYAACAADYAAAHRYLKHLGAQPLPKTLVLADQKTRFCVYQFTRTYQHKKRRLPWEEQ